MFVYVYGLWLAWVRNRRLMVRSSVLRFVKRSTVECWRRVSCAVWVSLFPVGAVCGELVDVQVPEQLLWYRFRGRRMIVCVCVRESEREREKEGKRLVLLTGKRRSDES
ncbi:uncharacterized protein CCOS01_02529 [Colletotrichum costaricense]|uniref:Uncharacterized protein n=1 Tax=Colletotrichum costaricense TaxID=1209916 RepID=A0AAI9Z9G9_9PEZI|nr:uncharacterized protein CCOS01_02529 [Colletotrichum costaricense]KAK1537209.1 hypothetical protein CCOS01_02529 [Colletotrichum costaricense]